MIDRSGARFPEDVTLAEDLDFYVRLYPFVERAFLWDGKSFCYRQTDSNYSKNENVDYYAQMRINLHIIEWFKHTGLYKQYREVLDRRITDYAYVILFDANEKKDDLRVPFEYLISNNEIQSFIKKKYANGFKHRVIAAVEKKQYRSLKLLFACRNILRRVYRAGAGKH